MGIGQSRATVVRVELILDVDQRDLAPHHSSVHDPLIHQRHNELVVVDQVQSSYEGARESLDNCVLQLQLRVQFEHDEVEALDHEYAQPSLVELVSDAADKDVVGLCPQIGRLTERQLSGGLSKRIKR